MILYAVQSKLDVHVMFSDGSRQLMSLSFDQEKKKFIGTIAIRKPCVAEMVRVLPQLFTIDPVSLSKGDTLTLEI